ncbi:hypothetical protein NBRC116188_17910 [Oceaniserpentilla sp. 4NH20-0058]|uniref:hypothetical protein n=1 Tax=Oceaniserpentilla sp. 4NH20-0058 TaxID=3127660 RepID=UPI00310655EC
MLYSAAQLTYLEHLGIDVWVPKDLPVQQSAIEPELTNTVAHSEAEFVAPVHYEDVPPAQYNEQRAEPAQAYEQAPSVTQVPAPTQSVPPAPMAAPNLNSALTSSIPAPAFPKAAQPETTQVNRLEFHVQFWCYSSGVWFISGDVNVTPQQHKLVHNLAQFIQGKKRKPRHVNVFSWPMIDSPNVDQGADVANKYLLSHIERLQQACEQKQVFVFNDCDFYPADLPHVKLDVTLNELLSNAQAKQVLWQQLLSFQLPE